MTLQSYPLLASSDLFTNEIVQTFDQEYLGAKFVQRVMKASLNIDIDIFRRYLSSVWAVGTYILTAHFLAPYLDFFFRNFCIYMA